MENNGKHKAITGILVACAIIFVLLYAIINIGVISNIFSYVINVFSPVLIGLAIAYVLNPILRLFEFKIYKKILRPTANRVLSIISTYIVALIIVAGFVYLLVPSIIETITEFANNYDAHIADTTELINRLIVKITENEDLHDLLDPVQIQDAIVKFFADSGDLLETVMEYVTIYGTKLFVGVKNTIFGIVISVYVLVSKEKLQAQTRKLCAAIFTEQKTQKLAGYVNLTHKTFSNYFLGSIFDCFVVMVLCLAVFLIADIPYAMLIAVIVGVTNIIPVLGPFLGAIPSFFIIFVSDPIKAFVFLVLIIIIQQIDGNIIVPKIHGNSTGISSLAVVVVVLIMGEFFGFIGMLIGVPLFAVITTILKEFIDRRLTVKGKTTDTADYYLKSAIVDPHSTHVPAVVKLYRFIVRCAKAIGCFFFKVIKKPCPWERKDSNCDCPCDSVDEDVQDAAEKSDNSSANNTDNDQN